MEVEFTHDIACVWSALAYVRFQRAAEEHRAGGGELEVVFRPYETEPSSTETPSGRGRLQPAPAARIEQIAQAAAADGLVVNLDRIVPAHTGEAHRLIALAAAHGNAEDMTARLYRAYFSDGLDIGDVNVLRGLASAIGVRWDGERSHAQPARPTRASGPRVPVFRFPDGTILVGAVSLANLRSELMRVDSPRRRGRQSSNRLLAAESVF
ncbi:hypothetical protein GCM10010402_18800 [Actinomadura luteofluorescens]|nr:putative dithiol-disulfide isomerase, DsbA family [Actinomadura glauciflava]